MSSLTASSSAAFARSPASAPRRPAARAAAVRVVGEAGDDRQDTVKKLIQIAKDEVGLARKKIDDTVKQHRRFVSGTKRFPEEARKAWADLREAWDDGDAEERKPEDWGWDKAEDPADGAGQQPSKDA